MPNSITKMLIASLLVLIIAVLISFYIYPKFYGKSKIEIPKAPLPKK